MENKEGQTLLLHAIDIHHETLKPRHNFVKYFIGNGSNVNALDKDRNTPLHYCIDKGNARLAQKLMRRPEIDGQIKNRNSLTPRELGDKLVRKKKPINTIKELKKKSICTNYFSLEGAFEINKTKIRFITFFSIIV